VAIVLAAGYDITKDVIDAADGRPLANPPRVPSPRMGVVDMALVSSETILGKATPPSWKGSRPGWRPRGRRRQEALSRLDAEINALPEGQPKQARLRERQLLMESGQAELQTMKRSAEAEAEHYSSEFRNADPPDHRRDREGAIGRPAARPHGCSRPHEEL